RGDARNRRDHSQGIPQGSDEEARCAQHHGARGVGDPGWALQSAEVVSLPDAPGAGDKAVFVIVSRDPNLRCDAVGPAGPPVAAGSPSHVASKEGFAAWPATIIIFGC